MTVLRFLGLVLVIWLAITVVAAIVKGLFWLAVVGLVVVGLAAVLGRGRQKNRL
jgi:LPXTG-motif cell wall-anchored protein